ncbi:hypothetical protein [Halococcus sediminicola]|uniref:hypothetical protein n=1 Tax=Halococcus sediminicola TaxID=1264579 RepID=UPI0012AB4AC2|nr:hypothetical protein [Halococcus sediminicola]
MPDDETPARWPKAEQPDDEMTRYSSQPVTEYEVVSGKQFEFEFPDEITTKNGVLTIER